MKTNRKTRHRRVVTDSLRSAVIAILLTLWFTASGAFDAGSALAQSRRKPTPKAGPQVKRRPGGLRLRRFEFDTVKVNSKGAITVRRKGHARYYVEQVKGVGLAMVEIPGGSFTMGANEDTIEGFQAHPAHRVDVPSFYIGKYEVTQAQWRAVAKLPKVSRLLNADPSHFKGENLPVEQVSWHDAREFCARLSKSTGRTYRLPSESEWDYACRARTTTPYAFGETITPEFVNYNGKEEYPSAPNGFRERTTPVGSMGVANRFGLYDMLGNVAEWCLDRWQDSYDGAPADGSPWEAGKYEEWVVRGGSWMTGFYRCHSGNRSYYNCPVGSGADVYGFRVVSVARTH